MEILGNTSWTVWIAKAKGPCQDMHTGNTSFVKDPLHQQRKGAYSDGTRQHMCNSWEKTRIHNYTCSILHHVCSQIQISSQRIYFNMKTPYHQKEYQFIHIHQLSVPAKVIYLCLWDVSAILANSWGDSMHCIFCSPLWSAGSTSMKSYNTFCVCYFSWHGHNHGASKRALSCVRNVP